MINTYIQVKKSVTITIEPEDYNKFVTLIEDSLAELNNIQCKIEDGDTEVDKSWKDILPQRKEYAMQLLKEINK